MLIFLAVLIALIPLVAIVYPFFRSHHYLQALDDSATKIDSVSLRWQALAEGVRIMDLDHELGNLGRIDYIEIRQKYLLEAEAILDEMGLSEQDRELMFSQISFEPKKNSHNKWFGV